MYDVTFYNSSWQGVGLLSLSHYPLPRQLQHRRLDSQNPDGNLHRLTMKTAENQNLDIAIIYTWFMQVHSQGQPISGPLICETGSFMMTSRNVCLSEHTLHQMLRIISALLYKHVKLDDSFGTPCISHLNITSRFIILICH